MWSHVCMSIGETPYFKTWRVLASRNIILLVPRHIIPISSFLSIFRQHFANTPFSFWILKRSLRQREPPLFGFYLRIITIDSSILAQERCKEAKIVESDLFRGIYHPISSLHDWTYFMPWVSNRISTHFYSSSKIALRSRHFSFENMKRDADKNSLALRPLMEGVKNAITRRQNILRSWQSNGLLYFQFFYHLYHSVVASNSVTLIIVRSYNNQKKLRRIALHQSISTPYRK